jgi:O-succinylbenzoate synthase
VRLVGVELRWLALHLRHTHRDAHGAHTERPIVLVRVVTDDGEGFGECAALGEPTYTEEYAQGAWDVLAQHLVPRLLAAGGPNMNQLDLVGPGLDRDVGWVTHALLSVQGHRMAKACLEMAVLDAALRSQGWCLGRWLGVERSAVEAGAVVSIADDVSALVADVERSIQAGYRRVKVKVAPGWDLEPVGAVRARFPELDLQVDANGSYVRADPDRLAALVALDDLGLLCIEQPFAPDDLVSHAVLSARLRTPVCLDESITSRSRLTEALQLGACTMVCIKPARLGGFIEARAVHDTCMAAGVGAWCGGMLETGLARAANAALAALPGFTIPGDLGGVDLFVEGDPSGVPAVVDGTVPVYRGVGVGPPPDANALADVTTRLEWYSSG